MARPLPGGVCPCASMCGVVQRPVPQHVVSIVESVLLQLGGDGVLPPRRGLVPLDRVTFVLDRPLEGAARLVLGAPMYHARDPTPCADRARAKETNYPGARRY